MKIFEDSILFTMPVLLMACGGAEPSISHETPQTEVASGLVTESQLDTIVAFSDSMVPVFTTVSMSVDGEFRAIYGATVESIEPGTLVSGAGVKLGGFHNDPIAYKITTPNGLEGFVSPEHTGLRIMDPADSSNRYIQAQDIIRLGHQGCPPDGPLSTITIWADGRSSEASCSDLLGILPEPNQGAVH
jgi:hypothetical protein